MEARTSKTNFKYSMGKVKDGWQKKFEFYLLVTDLICWAVLSISDPEFQSWLPVPKVRWQRKSCRGIEAHWLREILKFYCVLRILFPQISPKSVLRLLITFLNILNPEKKSISVGCYKKWQSKTVSMLQNSTNFCPTHWTTRSASIDSIEFNLNFN